MEEMIHNSYMAHGYCLLWKPWLVGLHGLSDLFTALAYFAIPIAIWIFVKRRQDLEMKNLAWMFVAFITLCGLTHVVGLITLWSPIYETEGWVKGATALVSVGTAIAIFPLIPKALAIPSPSQLQLVNAQLTEEIAAHKKTLAELEAARAQLAREVKETTQQLDENQVFLKRITDLAPTYLYVYDVQENRIDWMNKSFSSMIGYSKEELSEMRESRPRQLVHPDDQATHARHHAARLSLQPEEIIEAEYRLKAIDGSWHWLLIQEMGYQYDAEGRVKQIVCAAHDITERRAQEERIKLLMREVNHRAKNLLTVVQSITRQTARTTSPADFASNLSDRLRSLAASQDLIIQGEWLGVGVTDLVKSQLSHLDTQMENQIRISGTEISLSPAAAQGIGMALHELSTNALKYGALSVPEGRVVIDWNVEDRDGEARFSISWTESNGPPVNEPDHQGFGRTVIERMATHAVEGTVDLRYNPEGVRWTLSAPLENVQNEAASPPDAAPGRNGTV